MADKLLVDSDVLIEHLRGRDPVSNQLESVFGNDIAVFCSPVSKAEIGAGVRKGEEGVTASLFRLMHPILIDDRVGEKAGEYLRQYGKSHGLELGDALQAACARVFELRFWTLNRKHYPMNDIEFW